MNDRSPINRPLSRRQLVAITTGSAVIAIAGGALVAQSPPSAPGPQDFDKAARESHRENSATLAKFDIPMSLEPAFLFRA
jgi:hypothetical protein